MNNLPWNHQFLDEGGLVMVMYSDLETRDRNVFVANALRRFPFITATHYSELFFLFVYRFF